MTTTDTVLLIILTSLLSLLFILCIAVGVGILRLVGDVRRVVAKAEDVVDSVESVADVFKDTKGRMAFFKLVRNIVKLAKGSHKR